MQSGLDGMRRMIQEREPQRPSTRRTRIASSAKRPDNPSPSVSFAIEQDLDWVTLKCLEKDRDRRYDTAHALAQDLIRHLKHEPVPCSPMPHERPIQPEAVLVSRASTKSEILRINS